MIYDIVKELPNRKAVIRGEYRDLNIDNEVVIVDGAGTEYNAIVETRMGGGEVVVSVTDIAE